jgi:Fe-S cluster assembly protein SufD
MIQLFEDRFNGLKTKLPASEQLARQTAFDFFKTEGLPSRKDENWKYTSVQFLNRTAYQAPLMNEALCPHFYQVVFFNGVYQNNLSASIPGVKITAIELKIEKFDDSLMALNWALSENPIRMEIADGTIVDKPVQILFFTSSEEPSMSQPHLEIHVGPQSRLTLLESYSGAGPTVTNSYVKVMAGRSCHLTYVHCQEQDLSAYHIARTHFEICAGAHVESLSFSAGALMARHSQKYALKESDSFVKSLGLYIVADHQHSDHTGLIDHEVGRCTSYQIYKGLLKDQSRAVFNGRVLIRRDSQKAISEQVNKNLLLSNGAEIDSKPQLEIYADDVQARHGSTVGQLNPEELFYLNSRGISTKKALPLLSYGFLSDVIYQMTETQVIDWLKPKLQKVLQNIHLEDL